MGNPAAVPALVKSLHDTEEEVHLLDNKISHGHPLVGKGKTPIDNEYYCYYSLIRSAIIDALGTIGHESAVPALVQMLRHTNEDVRFEAVDSLIRIGKPAVGPLIKALSDGLPWVRKFAAKSLGEIGDETAIQALKKVLEGRHGSVYEEAEKALEKIKSKSKQQN